MNVHPSRLPLQAIMMLAALAALLLQPLLPPAAAQAPEDAVPGEILVRFRPGTAAATAADVHRRAGGAVVETLARINVQVVRVPLGREGQFIARYRSSAFVLFAEPNGVYRAIDAAGAPAVAWTPSDPKFGSQWQYNNTGQTGGTVDADIDAVEAWDVSQGNAAIPIAVLDTGIDQSHEDLKAKIVRNVNFSSAYSVDDKYGHGTHVAGSAAAVTNNAVGVAGTCPNCVLYNVKVLNDNGSGSWSGIANGIIWAADNGARVINMSLGGSSGSSAVESAVNYAWGKGVVIVAAAGNDGVSTPSYPAFYDHVIAVAATDDTDAKASWSNYGFWVDVAAPGVSILSTAPDHRNRIWGRGVKYGTISGTSMASPHAAGVAALVWSAGLCPDATCVRNRVEGRADAIAGTGTLWVYGRVNAYRSLTAP